MHILGYITKTKYGEFMKKIFICLLAILCVFTFSACQNNSMKTLNKIDVTLDKVQNLIESMDTISDDTLIIDNIMDEDDTQNTGYDGATFTSGSYAMDSFINNILKLSNTAHNAIDLNDESFQIVTEISQNIDDIKAITKIIIKNKKEPKEEIQKSINDMCTSVLISVNRLMITREDVTNELNSTLALKRNYTKNVDILTTKYTRLCSALETKNTYLNNINNSLNDIFDKLYDLYRPADKAQSVSNSFSNIDTYENATKSNKSTNNAPNINTPNNYNGYGYVYGDAGYGMTNPYYGYGGFMGGRRFGGYGGYPYSPYGRYNPYMPNIDSFGTYKNIDTYKSVEDINADEREIDENQEDDYDFKAPKIRKLRNKES